jgi:hypothetical protein
MDYWSLKEVGVIKSENKNNEKAGVTILIDD